MSRACIPLSVHDQLCVSRHMSRVFGIAYQRVANKVMKHLLQINLAIVMAVSIRSLANYLLKPPLQGQSHHLQGPSLEVVMDMFITLACHNFVSKSKHFVRSAMSIMDFIMALKKH